VGWVDAGATLALARRIFEPVRPRGGKLPAVPAEPAQRAERRASEPGEFQASVLLAGWHAPPNGVDDAPALDLIAGLLSRGPEARLPRSMVNGSQISVFVQRRGRPRPRAVHRDRGRATRRGQRRGQTSCSRNRPARARPVETGELDRARKQIGGDVVRPASVRSRSSARRGDHAQWRPRRGAAPVTLDALTPRFRAAARWLRPEHRTVVWLSGVNAGFARGESR
jgi:hypothetical protein